MSVQLLNPATGDQQTVEDAAAGYWVDRGWQIVDLGFPTGAPFINLPVPAVYSPGGCKALIDKLKFGVESAAVVTYGDSTGNNNSEWFFALEDWLKTKFPAYSFPTLAWSDAQQMWVPDLAGITAYTHQTGSLGDAYATGFAGSNHLQTADAAAHDITGDLDIRVRARAADWTPAAQAVLAAKAAGAGQRSWIFYLLPAGTLKFEGSVDGTAVISGTSSASVSFADNTDGWVRGVFTAATSKVDFYTSTDGVTWTALGTQQTAAGLTALFNSTTPVEIGSRLNGTDPFTGGRIYYVEVRAGIGSAGVPKIICDMDLAIGSSADITASGGTFVDALNLTWTRTGAAIQFEGSPGCMFYNGSVSGQVIGYSNDGTRGPIQRAIKAPDLAYINYGHNESGTSIRTAYKTLADACIAAWPDVGLIAVTQNPRMAPTTVQGIVEHAIRQRQIVSLASSQRYGLLDAFFAFLTDYRELDDLVQVDGVHPSQAGNDLWRDVGKAMFAPWIPYPRYDLIS